MKLAADVITDRIYELTSEAIEGMDISDESRKDYMYRVSSYINFIRFKGFSENGYLEYKRYLSKRDKLSISTKNKYLFAAKILLKEAYKKRIISADITSNVKGFQQSRKHKKTGLSPLEIQKIVSHCKGLKQTAHHLKFKSLISLLLFQGLRQIEIVRLNFSDIDLSNGKAFIRGKGCQDLELIWLHPETIKVLQLYINSLDNKMGPLFRSNSNNSRNQRLTTKSIREIVRKEFKVLGINKSIHGFRHFFTTQLLKSHNGNITKVAQLTRHKCLETLQVYNDFILSEKELKIYIETFNEHAF